MVDRSIVKSVRAYFNALQARGFPVKLDAGTAYRTARLAAVQEPRARLSGIVPVWRSPHKPGCRRLRPIEPGGNWSWKSRSA